ncbi:MAG: SH3 domain-containing protein [Clostridia bacterium]|nr:SH3 domain-containing protein [Clostridia bacterium]
MKGSKMMKRMVVLALVAALLLAILPASALAASYLEATGDRVSVRSGPGTSYSGLYTLVRGETVTYTGEYAYDGNGMKWYKVQYYSYGTGWVSSKYSKVYDDGSGLDWGVQPYVQATGGSVNIRRTPSLTGQDLGTMSNGQTATYLGQSTTDDRGVTWYYVNFDGIVGWVSSRYSKLYGSSALTWYVQAEGGNANVRQTPSLTGTSLDVIHDGEYATYLGQTSTDSRGVLWYYVNFDGTVGWVSSRYCTLYSGEHYVQAEGGNVNVRQTPELTGKNLDTMYDGEYATYLNQTSTDSRGVLWYYVNYDGIVGWVSSRYARLI